MKGEHKMKLKHWQGYGCITATKIKSKNNELVIKVCGNHECGIERDDLYDIFNWLVKRFDKESKSMSFQDWKMKHNPTMTLIPDMKNGVEECTYILKYAQ